MSTEEIEEFEVDGEKIGVVRDFIFLGAKIEDSGSCKGEILRRLALGRAAMTGLTKIWKDKYITITTNCRIVNALVFPVVLYGCESWTIRKAERRRIDSFELWRWRRLLRIPWTARRTNKSVIEEIKATNPLETLIKKQQLSYFGHIMRRENSLEKSIMLGMGGGSRKRGRPRARWLDDIKAVTNCTLAELCGSARDRDTWRKMIMAITRSRTRLDGTRYKVGDKSLQETDNHPYLGVHITTKDVTWNKHVHQITATLTLAFVRRNTLAFVRRNTLAFVTRNIYIHAHKIFV